MCRDQKSGTKNGEKAQRKILMNEAVGLKLAHDITYGSAVLPGAMFLLAYLSRRTPDNMQIPVLGVPACAIYHKTTIFDLILPRVLPGEAIGRKELAALGHGGLCLNCAECRYPLCLFGKE
jgi:hypothetical protein